MAGGAPNMDRFELYFKRADLDQDGRISGPEAVFFFQASGLPKPVLAQIWTHADQNQTGYLGRTEFYNALKLVTVAQSKRDLTPDIVKAALYGPASAKIPAPHINLGALPAPPSNLTVSPPALQMGGGPPAASVSMGTRGPQGYSSQQNQGMRPPHPQLPDTTFQPLYGVSNGMPNRGMVGTSRPPNSNISSDSLGGTTGGLSPGVSSQVPGSRVSPSTSPDGIGLASSALAPSGQPRPQGVTSLLPNVEPQLKGPTPAANGARTKDSSSPVAGNGLASSSAFGNTFSAALSRGIHNSVATLSSAGGLPVSSSKIPVSARIQSLNKPNSFQSNIAQQPAASQNQ